MGIRTELLAVLLAMALAVFAGFLTGLAGLASQRFGERRFLLVALAFLIVTVVAVLAIVAELDLFNVSWFDEAFALEPVPLALLLVAVLLVYAAMGGRGGARGESSDGGR